jgi:hypothetical protein
VPVPVSATETKRNNKSFLTGLAAIADSMREFVFNNFPPKNPDPMVLIPLKNKN